MFSPKPPALSSRYAQYLTQRTRLRRISQVKSHQPLYYGLYPIFSLLEIHTPPLTSQEGTHHCQGHGSWWISVLLLSVEALMCSSSQSFPSLEYQFHGRNSVVTPWAHAHSDWISSLFPAFSICALLGIYISSVLAMIFQSPSCATSPAASPEAFPTHIALASSLPHHNISTTSHLSA